METIYSCSCPILTMDGQKKEATCDELQASVFGVLIMSHQCCAFVCVLRACARVRTCVFAAVCVPLGVGSMFAVFAVCSMSTWLCLVCSPGGVPPPSLLPAPPPPPPPSQQGPTPVWTVQRTGLSCPQRPEQVQHDQAFDTETPELLLRLLPALGCFYVLAWV